MKVYALEFPMRDKDSGAPLPPRGGIFSARQLNAFFKAWEGLVADGELPAELRVKVKTIEADGPADDRDLFLSLRE